MRVVMINPPSLYTVVEVPDEKGREFLEADSFGDFPPLGALYVLSNLEAKTDHECFLLDCVAEGISHERLREKLIEIAPDVVGITSFTIGLVDVRMVAETAKEVAPHAHICLGGHHPIAYPKEASELDGFDSIVVGEGEEAFAELVECLNQGRDFTHIRGVYTRESIKPYMANPIRDKRFLARVGVPSGYIEDLDALPMVDRKHIRHLRYQNILGVTNDLATILSSRGCPYKCTFCDVPIKSYRQRSAKSVVDEIEACLAMGYKEFRFYDDLFNINEKKVVQFCDELDRRRLKIDWEFRGRVNTITREMLIRAKATGLRMVSFGVETGTDEGLKILKKATNTAKVKQAFKWCRELGILTVADYIIGHSFEKTVFDIKRNIDFLIKLDPDYAQISVLKLYPNTEVFEEACEKGLAERGRWQEFARNPTKNFVVDHWSEHFDLPTLVKFQKRAYRRFYFRPNYILRNALKTRSWVEFKSKVGGALKLIHTNKRSA